MITYLDTESLRDTITEAKTLQAELLEEINKLYERLDNVPDGTEEWVGQKARFYFDTISQDKNVLIDFCDSLEKQNIKIENIINEAETTIGK